MIPYEAPLTATLESSSGWITFNTITGDVVAYSTDTPGYLDNIVRIDVGEWRQRYPGETLDGGDILDFGYWQTINGELVYEPPVEEHRDREQ